MSSIDKLGPDYFVTPVTARGIPALAAALVDPADPSVGISSESFAEVLLYTTRGGDAGWLEAGMTDDDHTDVETQVWEALKEERDDADMDAAGDQYEEREYDREFFGSY